jgi:hypothetical protein
LASVLVPAQKIEVISEAIAIARTIEEDTYRIEELASFAPYLSLEEIDDLFVQAKSTCFDGYFAKSLQSLARFLAPRRVVEALAAVKKRTWHKERALALGALAPRLSVGQIQWALAVAKEIGDEYYIPNTLEKLARVRAELSETAVVPKLWDDTVLSLLVAVANKPRDDALRWATDTGVLEPLWRLGGAFAFDEMERAIRDVSDWYR